jgi:hypothetical protein
LSPKARSMSRLSSDKAFDSSSKSLLSRMGLKANTADANRPLLLKNDDNFLEHRKVLVQRWKDNIRSKGLDVSLHGDEDKEEEVSLNENRMCYFVRCSADIPTDAHHLQTALDLVTASAALVYACSFWHWVLNTHFVSAFCYQLHATGAAVLCWGWLPGCPCTAAA